jgi:hypothetical protein
LLNHVYFHGVVIFHVAHELCQFNFFLDQRSGFLFGFRLFRICTGDLLVLTDVAFIFVFIVSLLVSRVVDGEHLPHNGCAAEVVDSEIATPLIFVFQPTKALALSCFLVAHEADPDGLAILREDCDDVSFGEVEVEAADVDVGRVAVVGVPGGVGGDDFFEFALVEALDLLDLVHGDV